MNGSIYRQPFSYEPSRALRSSATGLFLFWNWSYFLLTSFVWNYRRNSTYDLLAKHTAKLAPIPSTWSVASFPVPNVPTMKRHIKSLQNFRISLMCTVRIHGSIVQAESDDDVITVAGMGHYCNFVRSRVLQSNHTDSQPQAPSCFFVCSSLVSLDDL